MELHFKVSEERQKVWIERLQEAIQKNQKELDAQLPSFEAIEIEYLEWKGKIDGLKSTIKADSNDLETFVQASKLVKPPAKVVEGMKKFTSGVDKWKPSTQIRWENVITPALIKLGKFVSYRELWEFIDVEKNRVNHKRFYVACSSKRNSWRTHEKKIGLIEWFDGDTIKQEYLRDFISTKIKVG